jgi:hypothetical protein
MGGYPWRVPVISVVSAFCIRECLVFSILKLLIGKVT